MPCSAWREGYVAVFCGSGLHLSGDVVDEFVLAGRVISVVALLSAEHRKIIIITYGWERRQMITDVLERERERGRLLRMFGLLFASSMRRCAIFRWAFATPVKPAETIRSIYCEIWPLPITFWLKGTDFWSFDAFFCSVSLSDKSVVSRRFSNCLFPSSRISAGRLRVAAGMQTSIFPFEPRQARAVSLNVGWGLVVSAATCWPCPTWRGGGRSACCDYYVR